MAAPFCNFEFFMEISQVLLRPAPGLVRTCEIFENWGNPWQSLEYLSYPVKSTGVSVRVVVLKIVLNTMVIKGEPLTKLSRKPLCVQILVRAKSKQISWRLEKKNLSLKHQTPTKKIGKYFN